MELLANLHPVIVHFPIAFFVAFFLLEAVSFFMKKEMIFNWATFTLGAGVVTALLAAITGNQSHEYLKPVLKSKPVLVEQLISNHEQFATITLWFFVAIFALRIYLLLKKKFSVKWKAVFLILVLVGMYFVYQTGILGGTLVFDFGVGTKLFSE